MGTGTISRARFLLLVRDYIERFGINQRHRVLDPFCGTGTVLVECKKLGIPSVGIEANPMAHLASQVKVDWSINPDHLIEHARHVAMAATAKLTEEGIEDNPFFRIVQDDHPLRTLPPESLKLLLANSISPLPLHKTLVLLECLEQHYDEQYHRHELLALAKSLVYSISNLHFGPEVGVGPAKDDAPVISAWLAGVRTMANDLSKVCNTRDTPAEVHLADSRKIVQVLEPHSIDAVITSPPYPNEKDYTRTTRLESILLGLIHNKAELQALKRSLVRSNTRGVYKEDDDDQWVAEHLEIQRIAKAIEARRVELGKTSGFERLYARVTKLYFGGIARHLATLRAVLRPGAQLAYVVGDQASYLRVMIPTGQLLADIAQSLGYELVCIDLFRTRLATATKEQLREEVVVLRWSGEDWIIQPSGRSRYRFVATTLVNIVPNKVLAETKVPDATPGVIAMYALGDEQALLAKLRYNRLVDIFTGVACYSLQNHLRTTVPNIGQVETDEIYIGIDRRGAHYVFPIQAKGAKDKLGIVQVEQDFALCADKFPSLICRPIAAQMMEDDLIALFEFEEGEQGVVISTEKHYRLVPSIEVSPADLDAYRSRSM